MNEIAVVQKVSLHSFDRILAISDVHGDLSLLKKLLDSVGFCRRDALILLGDLTEKGPDSLNTVRFVTRLARNGNVWCVAGNCETELLARLRTDNAAGLRDYMELRRNHWQRRSLLWEMSAEAGLDALYEQDILAFQQELQKHFSSELELLRSLPSIVESEDCIFVHAGLEHPDLSTLTQKSCVRQTAWLTQSGPRFTKAVIVGHWPVVLYGTAGINANPRYNAGRNVFAIDGGCMIHEDGQINCLIRTNTNGCWSYAACDSLPKAIILQPQYPQNGFCFRWGDNAVDVLDRKNDLVRCRHRRTGYETDIPARFLYPATDGAHVSNFSTALLPLCPGDTVSVLLSTTKGYYIKKNGVSGWYRGRLRFTAPDAGLSG